MCMRCTAASRPATSACAKICAELSGNPLLTDIQAVEEEPEYGYLQIDGFATKQRKKNKGIVPGPKRWVPLPRGTKVDSYSFSRTAVEAQWSKRDAKPLRSCLSRGKAGSPRSDGSPRSILSESSESTAASASDSRRIRFCDGLLPGCVDAADSLQNTGVPLAEWVYVDRDICGFSLYEYAPGDAYYKYFASSHHARMFLAELANIESISLDEQQKVSQCQSSCEAYFQEEQVLNESLSKAGVRRSCIYNLF